VEREEIEDTHRGLVIRAAGAIIAPDAITRPLLRSDQRQSRSIIGVSHDDGLAAAEHNRRMGIARRHWFALVLLPTIAATALALGGCGDDSEESSGGASAPASAAVATGGGQLAGSGISVTGTGAVSAIPDQARFSFGVRAEASTAEEALAETSKAAEALVDALKGAGIDEADLQTQQVSVFPLYTGDANRVTGYTASNSVSALVRDLDAAGAVVDAAVMAGANEVFGPMLDISDKEALAEEALGLAVEQARTRAAALAAAAGVEVGDVIGLAELGGPVAPLGRSADVAEEAGFAPIEPGTQEVRVTVSATFAIR
jgi:uncharacterized protein YggE